MSAALIVLDGGVGNTVQDAGRFGWRHLGVPTSGALDPDWLLAANALVGNAPDAAALEMRWLGPRLQVEGAPVTVGVVGSVTATVERAGGVAHPLPPWHALTLQPGDVLRMGAVQGLAYLAVGQGFAVAAVLGSRSTHERSAMGGVQGRGLRSGDRLPCTAAVGEAALAAPAPLPDDTGPIRVLPGPQLDHFAADALQRLCDTEWRLTSECDRMGMRLAGPPLQHRSPAHADIASDGVVPGAIQVPASGQPIVLLADAQTVGGYPKIAVVIRADLGRLARWPAAQPVRFHVVTLAQAHAALRARAHQLRQWCAQLRPWRPPGYLDLDRLYRCNLIGGVIDATAAEERA